jgi:hypothetical protein
MRARRPRAFAALAALLSANTPGFNPFGLATVPAERGMRMRTLPRTDPMANRARSIFVSSRIIAASFARSALFSLRLPYAGIPKINRVPASLRWPRNSWVVSFLPPKNDLYSLTPGLLLPY